MKKKHAVVGFMLLFLCSLVFIGVNLSGKIKEDVDLKNEIIETVEKSDEIDFNQITNFEWDKMYIFTQYSNPKDILREDGISTRNSQFNIEYLDTINMIGFIKSDKLVAFVELPLNYMETDLINSIFLIKEESKFKISKDKKIILSGGYNYENIISCK